MTTTPVPGDRLLALWEYLVDPEVGIVREVAALPVDEDEPAFVHYLSTACDTSRLTQLKNFGNNGGVSINHREAIAKALGEAVERYCSAFVRYADLVVAPYSELPGPATPPESYALYSDEQLASGELAWAQFTETSPVAWTTGLSLRSGERVFVPAAMVFVPFHYFAGGRDAPIVQPISTGLAAGGSFDDATLGALCEAIERDAFTIMWQARLSRPRVPTSTLPSSCQERLRRFADASIAVEIVDITTDIAVPTALTIALGDAPTSPAVAVAAATHPDPDVAVVKSLDELAHTRKFARQVMRYTEPLPVDVDGGHPQVLEQTHHLRFYCPQTAKRFIQFAWASEEERAMTEAPAVEADAGTQLDAVIAQVVAAGLDVIACDLTTPDIAELGLHVVRTVVPGLHPLFMGYRNRALGGHRLYEVPARVGASGIARGDRDNPYPHPFP